MVGGERLYEIGAKQEKHVRDSQLWILSHVIERVGDKDLKIIFSFRSLIQ